MATKFIAYYRVSTDKQGRSGLGIDAQREAVRQRLTREGGFPPLAEFTETESGRKVRRLELAKALAACRVHKATLIVAKLDRLARNQQFLMSIKDSGVDVVFGDLPGGRPIPERDGSGSQRPRDLDRSRREVDNHGR